MAQVKCKECGKEISESAKVCPSCGVDLPGVPDEKIEVAVKRNNFLQQRWIAGLAFWPGILLVVYPMFSGQGKDAVVSAWGFSKWLIGFGVLWYIVSEIERNLYERKIAKSK
jgi:hypothetical protein